MAPLNRQLFSALQDAFGEVRIASEGEPLRAAFRQDAITGKTRLDKDRSTFGEYYQVCCPICRDSRFRLWVNHAYGTEAGGMKLNHLVKCYNENCEHGDGFWEWFDSQLAAYTRTGGPKRLAAAPVQAAEQKVIQFPAVSTPLDKLPHDHPAVRYVRDVRKFDPNELAREWHVCWCDTLEPYYRLRDRILIPAYAAGKNNAIALAGWQARYLDRLTLSDKPPTKAVKKYINPPGFKKAQLLFNGWRCANSPFVVVTEGPFDAIRVGTHLGVALFGKSASANQKRILWDTWGARQAPIVVLLDPDAEDESEDLFSEFSRYTKKIYRISVPPGMDAAKLQQDVLLGAIAETLAKEQSTCIR